MRMTARSIARYNAARRFRGLFGCLLGTFCAAGLLLCASADVSARTLSECLSGEEAEAARAAASRFDGERWFRSVRELSENGGLRSRYAFRVRRAAMLDGSPPPDAAADLAADWIMERLREYGYEPVALPFPHTLYSSFTEKAAEFEMRNIAAEKRGSGPNAHQAILLTAHYDSTASRTEGWSENWREAPAPGANDNASGVAAALEAARIFADERFDLTVRFVFFAGEELGLFGSRRYARSARERGESIAGVLNVDMIGFESIPPYDLHVVANRNGEWLLQTADAAARALQSGMTLHLRRDPGYLLSDHAAFWEEGYSAVHFTEEFDLVHSPEAYRFYHTADDAPEALQTDYAAEAARLFIAAASLAARPLAAEGARPRAGRIASASAYPNPYRLGGEAPLTIQCQLAEPSRIETRIYDASGNAAFRSVSDGQIGLNTAARWDGRTAAGEPAASGLYFASVSAESSDGASDMRTIRILALPGAGR